MITPVSADQRTSLVEMKDVPQDEAQEAVNQYYSAKYHKCIKPQRKRSRNNSFRKYRKSVNLKSIPKKKRSKSKTRKTKSKSKSMKNKKRSKSKGKKGCVIKKNSYTKSRKHYSKHK